MFLSIPEKTSQSQTVGFCMFTLVVKVTDVLRQTNFMIIFCRKSHRPPVTSGIYVFEILRSSISSDQVGMFPDPLLTLPVRIGDGQNLQFSRFFKTFYILNPPKHILLIRIHRR